MKSLGYLFFSVSVPLLTLALSGSGCVSGPTENTANEVQADLQERSGYSIEWRRTKGLQSDVQQRVDALLADELTQKEAVQIALLNNKRLQTVYENLGISQAQLVDAGLLENPELEGLYKSIHGDGHTWEFALVQKIMDAAMIPLRKQVAAHELARTKANVKASVMDVILQVRRAYYELQAEKQTVLLLRDVVAATDAGYDLGKKLREAGNVTRLEKLQRRALRERARLGLSAAELRVAERREALNRVMGLWGDETQWQLPAELPRLPNNALGLQKLEKRVVEKSLGLNSARRKMLATAKEAGITKITSIIPDLQIGVEGEREPDGTWAVGPLFSMAIPIFDFGQTERAVAESKLRKAWNDYTAQAVEVRSRARAARHRLLKARQRVTYYNEVVLPLQKKIMKETHKHFNAMQFGAFRLLQTKQEEITARRRYVDNLRNYWIARAEMMHLLNGGNLAESEASIGGGSMPAGDMGSGGH